MSRRHSYPVGRPKPPIDPPPDPPLSKLANKIHEIQNNLSHQRTQLQTTRDRVVKRKEDVVSAADHMSEQFIESLDEAEEATIVAVRQWYTKQRTVVQEKRHAHNHIVAKKCRDAVAETETLMEKTIDFRHNHDDDEIEQAYEILRMKIVRELDKVNSEQFPPLALKLKNTDIYRESFDRSKALFVDERILKHRTSTSSDDSYTFNGRLKPLQVGSLGVQLVSQFTFGVEQMLQVLSGFLQLTNFFSFSCPK